MFNLKKCIAEALGTFFLVSAVCGATLIGFDGGNSGAGIIGIGLTVGLTVMAMIYTFGDVSGAHFNPAVTVGAWAAGRFDALEIPAYIVSQFIGGASGAAVFFFILSSQSGFIPGDFASNGFGPHSPGGYPLIAVMVAEILLTGMFVMVIMAASSAWAPMGFAGLVIGLALMGLHGIAIPISGLSLNPARSTATALFADAWALQQLWVFWAAPLIGGIAGGALWRVFEKDG